MSEIILVSKDDSVVMQSRRTDGLYALLMSKSAELSILYDVDEWSPTVYNSKDTSAIITDLGVLLSYAEDDDTKAVVLEMINHLRNGNLVEYVIFHPLVY
jgi:hypothetical protein